MQHRFRILRTGEDFSYDNQTNGLLDTNGTHISKPFEEPGDWNELCDRFNKHTVVHNPETIKISMGQACNYNCDYCVQKDIGNPNERSANGLVPMLVKNIKRHLDTSETTRIELWGGETLLYWKDMMPIMEEFDREGVTWYIPTNGTLLMHKHIDFFMQLRGTVAMGISHDGPAHERLRGKEFLHKKIEIFQRINEECGNRVQYSFNPVISKSNYDLFQINDFFVDFFAKHQLTQKSLSFEVGRVYDESRAADSTHHVISGEDLQKYHDVLTRYLSEHIKQFTDMGETLNGPLLATNLFHTGMGVLPFARTLYAKKIPLLKSNCGADDSRLISMDMLGNVRACQNADDKFVGGNIIDLKGVKIHTVNFNRDGHCDACHVRRLCKSSCPLDLGPATFSINCAVERIHYSAIQLAAFKLLFKSDVTIVE